MLRSLKSLKSFRIAARDGEIGSVHDFFFDNLLWIVRYLVVDTGHWLPGRKVLLSPQVLGQPDWGETCVPVELTREQVKSSPEIDTDKPVSRQRESELHQHYGWSFYWTGGGVWPNPVVPLPAAVEVEPSRRTEAIEQGDPHLRSMWEVLGYHIQASDGSIGHADDLIVEDATWVIRYLVVELRNWLPGRKVLIAPQWFVGPIKWAERKVHVFMTRESIRNSPLFDPQVPVNRGYEIQLYDYYGRPGYWWLKPKDIRGQK